VGANVGASRANNFPRQADGYGQATDDHPARGTNPDDAERLTGIYGSEGWRFESLRARPAHKPIPILGAASTVAKRPALTRRVHRRSHRLHPAGAACRCGPALRAGLRCAGCGVQPLESWQLYLPTAGARPFWRRPSGGRVIRSCSEPPAFQRVAASPQVQAEQAGHRVRPRARSAGHQSARSTCHCRSAR